MLHTSITDTGLGGFSTWEEAESPLPLIESVGGTKGPILGSVWPVCSCVYVLCLRAC